MKKIWTFEEAKKILPVIMILTHKAYADVEELQKKIKNEILHENILEQLEDKRDYVINKWASQIMELGIDIKGLWLVDFDHGDGYYCWMYGEEDLLFEHGYSEGFLGRRLIDKENINE